MNAAKPSPGDERIDGRDDARAFLIARAEQRDKPRPRPRTPSPRQGQR